MSSPSSGSISTDSVDPVIKLAYQCGDLTEQAVTMVTRFAKTWNISGFDALLECRVVSETRIVDIISSRGGFDRCPLDMGPESINRDVLAKVPFAEARRLRSIPLTYDPSQNLLTCVIANPLDREVITALEGVSKCTIVALIAERTRIEFILGELYPSDMQVPMNEGR